MSASSALAGGRSFCLRCIRRDSTHHLIGGAEIAFDIPHTQACFTPEDRVGILPVSWGRRTR